MARKIGFYSVLLFIMYGLFFYWYLFYFADSKLPFEYQDPPQIHPPSE